MSINQKQKILGALYLVSFLGIIIVLLKVQNEVLRYWLGVSFVSIYIIFLLICLVKMWKDC